MLPMIQSSAMPFQVPDPSKELQQLACRRQKNVLPSHQIAQVSNFLTGFLRPVDRKVPVVQKVGALVIAFSAFCACAFFFYFVVVSGTPAPFTRLFALAVSIATFWLGLKLIFAVLFPPKS
jgi:hypothetical protein